MFHEDFTLCLILGDIQDDPILSQTSHITVSVYGPKAQFRSSKLSSMHLQIAEGHVLGQVISKLRKTSPNSYSNAIPNSIQTYMTIHNRQQTHDIDFGKVRKTKKEYTH